jgi:uridine kinase
MNYENWLQYNKECIQKVDRTKPFVIGLAGGSACGKTSVADIILKLSGVQSCSRITMDSYYKNLTDEQYENISEYNFDHPNAFDFDLLFQHLNSLLSGREVNVPVYDFTYSKREPRTLTVKPSNLIIIEGILVFYDRRIRNMLDVKAFIDADSDVRLARRSKIIYSFFSLQGYK